MKRKMIITTIFLMLIFLGKVSYAAVEIVPSKNGKGTDGMVKSNVSNSYLLCQNMKNVGESLNGTSVLPHLATNADWGAVSYLSNSIYGTNTAGGNTGSVVSIDGVNYYSTTGNETGIMNWGANPNATRYTQTAGIIKAYADAETSNNNSSTARDYVKELYNNRASRYVDVINTGSFNVNNTLGMALAETKKIYSNIWAFGGARVDYPISIRQGLFGFNVGDYGSKYTTGAAYDNVTFRPVIWNK